MGGGGYIMAVMLNPRARSSNSDLPPPPSDDGLDLPGRRFPHLEPNDGVLGVLPHHVRGDEADLSPGGLRQAVHDPNPPDGGLNEGPWVPSHPLVPD